MMIRLKFGLFLAIVVFALSGCSPNNVVDIPAQTISIQPSNGYVNPYPILETQVIPENSENQPNQFAAQGYPAPESNSDLPVVIMYPENFITGLEVPSPDGGLAVITGQLMNAGETDKPYITALYLAPVEPSTDPDQAPVVNFSRKTNQMAIQDIENGRFFFEDVKPGQYAVVIWNPGGSFFLKDSGGTTLVIDGKIDKVNDLGVIFFE